jgi:hypothetical protein
MRLIGEDVGEPMFDADAARIELRPWYNLSQVASRSRPATLYDRGGGTRP